jgi:hypothetical protein
MISLLIEKKAFVRGKFMDIEKNDNMSKYKNDNMSKYNLYLE